MSHYVICNKGANMNTVYEELKLKEIYAKRVTIHYDSLINNGSVTDEDDKSYNQLMRIIENNQSSSWAADARSSNLKESWINLVSIDQLNG